MSLKSLKQGISEELNGVDCKLCEPHGVTCHRESVFESFPAVPRVTPRNRVSIKKEEIYTTGDIRQCPGYKKEITPEQASNNTIDNIRKIKSLGGLGTFGNY